MQDIPSVPFKSNRHILKYTASTRYAEHVDGATFTNIICTVIDRGTRTTAVLFDPRMFEGQTKLLLPEKLVYNCFVIQLHFFKLFLFTLSTRTSIRCFQYHCPSSPRRQYHVTY